jgi:pyruvate/2-oxoglutarate dehydrogenase complex dihydrolipoamide acyltransferase (E2) component
MKEAGNYDIKEFPKSRLAIFDFCEIGLKKHYMQALIEMDVTEARRKIHALKRDGADISFTAWLLKCIGDVCAQYREIHAVRYGRLKTVMFDDVDISIVVEREVNGAMVPLPYVIRKANEKSITGIFGEIEAAKKQSIRDESDFILGGRRRTASMKVYYALPGFVRRLFIKSILRNPFRLKNEMGTVVLTALGMMGKFKGWFVPIGVHPLEFCIGSIVKKPGVAKDKIEIREFIYITVLADHVAVDGAPAARALQKLTKMIESGYGL